MQTDKFIVTGGQGGRMDRDPTGCRGTRLILAAVTNHSDAPGLQMIFILSGQLTKGGGTPAVPAIIIFKSFSPPKFGFIKGDLGADSLMEIEIAMAMEERFKLAIPDEQWENVATVGDLLATVAALQGAQRP